MEHLNQLRASIHTPGEVLDTRNEIVCSCGYKRDCGVMRTTAEHLCNVHNDRTGHDAVIVESPCKPPPRQETIKPLKPRRRKGNDAKLGIE